MNVFIILCNFVFCNQLKMTWTELLFFHLLNDDNVYLNDTNIYIIPNFKFNEIFTSTLYWVVSKCYTKFRFLVYLIHVFIIVHIARRYAIIQNIKLTLLFLFCGLLITLILLITLQLLKKNYLIFLGKSSVIWKWFRLHEVNN